MSGPPADEIPPSEETPPSNAASNAPLSDIQVSGAPSTGNHIDSSQSGKPPRPPANENVSHSLTTGCNLRLHVHHKAAPEFTLHVNVSNTSATIGHLKKIFIAAYNRKHGSAHALTEINVLHPEGQPYADSVRLSAFKDRDDVHIQRADARVEQPRATRPRRPAAAAGSDSDLSPSGLSKTPRNAEKSPRAEGSRSPSAPRRSVSFSASCSSLPDVLYADLPLVRSSSEVFPSLSSLRTTSPLLPSSSVTPAPVTAQTEGMELAVSSATSAPVNPTVELAGSTPAPVNVTAQPESMELSASPVPVSVAPTEGVELAASSGTPAPHVTVLTEAIAASLTSEASAPMEIAAIVPPMQLAEEQSSASSDPNDSQTSTTQNDVGMGDSDNHSHDSSDASTVEAVEAALHVPVTPPGAVSPPDPTLLSWLIENSPEFAAPSAPK